MRWSKLKQSVEARFAERARGRVALTFSRWRRSHDATGELLITLDGRPVHRAAYLGWLKEQGMRLAALRAARAAGAPLDWDPDPARPAHAVVDAALRRDGVQKEEELVRDLRAGLDLSMEAILASDATTVRAMGMLDARLGRRRLAAMVDQDEVEPVRRFLALRFELEGMPPAASRRPAP